MYKTVLFLAMALCACACGGDPSERKAAAPEAMKDKPPPPQFEFQVPETEYVEAGAPDGPDPSETKPKAKPQAKYEDAKEIKTTVGEGGALYRLGGDAVLRIPEETLRQGKNVYFAIVSGAGKADGRVGNVYAFEKGVFSHGPPFELTLPMPLEAGAVKLVILRKWKPKKAKTYERIVVEPKAIDTAKGTAYFELTRLYKSEIWLTTKP